MCSYYNERVLRSFVGLSHDISCISIPQFHNPLSAFHNNGDIRILSFESWLKSPVYTFSDNF